MQSIAQGICKPDNPYLFDALLRQADTVAFPDQPGKTFPLAERQQKAEAFYWEQARFADWFGGAKWMGLRFAEKAEVT